MIERLTPDTRKQLVQSRCLAMQGKLPEVLEALDKSSARATADKLRFDAIAIRMLMAELLYLDHKSTRALEVFRDSIDPETSELPDEMRLLIADNRNSIHDWSNETWLREFYVQVDERRLAGVDLWDSSKLLTAKIAAEDDKHFESLPLIWNELVRSYIRGSWRSYWVASNYMAKECLQLGWPHEAIYHSVVAHNSKLAEEIGKQLLERREPALIQATMEKLLSSANLHLHALVGCSLIGVIGDAIPQAQIANVFRWLLTWCKQPRYALDNGGLLEKSWHALEKIVWGLNTEQLREVVHVVVAHAAWNRPDYERRHLVPVIRRCVDRLPVEDLPALTRHVLPLATNLKCDTDFIETINLLFRLADRGKDAVRTLIADAVFPIGVPITNSVLAQAAPEFGRQYTDAQGLDRKAEEIAAQLRLMVQRLKPEEEPVKVSGGFWNISQTKDNQKLVVQRGANTLAIGVLVKHRDLLSHSALKSLFESILLALAEPENLVSTKMELAQVLAEFGEKIDPEYAEKVFASLLPFAEGQIIEPPISMSWKQANDPLNPFKMRDANPAELRGIAVYALARIERLGSGIFGDRFYSLLEAALSETDPDVRRLAFAAAREAPILSDAALTAVLMGTRDANPEAAAAAYYALAWKKGLKLTDGQWELLFHALRFASQAQDAGLRKAAARATTNLSPQAPEFLKQQIQVVIDAFSHDLCHSVRAAVQNAE